MPEPLAQTADAGQTSAGPVRRVTIGRAPGPVLQVLDLGATMHTLEVTGGDGVRRNVLLGHATPQEYLDSTAYLGGTIGRYANRIAAGRVVVDGTAHELGTNDRGHHLHGGPEGFDSRVWQVVDLGESEVTLSLESPDGDQGYPGTVRATARFSVSAAGSTAGSAPGTDDEVRLDLTATTDAPTLVNLTSHAYVNLAGDGSIDDHVLRLPAARFTPVDGTGIPTGGHQAVDGTPFDFRDGAEIGPRVRVPHPQVVAARGIDHNVVVDGTGLRTVASLESDRARLRLVLRSDQPGLQVYTGNFLDGSQAGTDGRLLRQGSGIALEPQLFPDTPNQPDFGSAELRPGDTYHASIVWVWQAT